MGHRLRIMAITAALTTTVLVATTAWMLHDSRLAARNHAEQVAKNLVLTLGQNITRNIELYDASLRTALATTEQIAPSPGGAERRQANLFDTSFSAQDFGPVIITNSAGQIIYDAGAPQPRNATYAGVEWFETIRSRPQPGTNLFAMRKGQLTGRSGLIVSRRIVRPNGEFDGAVTGAIYLDYFTRLFASVALNPGDIVALRTTDGHLIARQPALAAAMDTVLPDAEILRRARVQPTGAFEHVSGVDGVRRLNVYTSLGNNLVIEVGFSMQTIYGEWWNKALAIGSILVGFIAITLSLLYAMRQDLHRRRRLERMLREGEASYRLLTEQSSDMVTRVGTDGSQTYVSPAASRVVGWTPEALTGRNPVEIVHNDDRIKVATAYRRLAAGEAEVTLAYRVIRADGSEAYVEMSGQAFRDPATQLQDGCVVVTRDVTERQEVNERLRASEARFRLLAEHATDVVSLVGPDGRRLYISPACQRILGLPPELLLVRGIDSIISPDDRGRVADLQRRLLAGAETGNVSFRVLHPEHGIVWTEVSAGAIFHPVTGKPDGYVSVLRDISRHKQAQAAMSEANRWLTLSEQMARLGHWRYEPASSRLHFSAESFRIYGLDPESSPLSMDQAIAACAFDDQPKLQEAVGRAIRERSGFNLVIRIVRPDGDVRHVDARAIVQAAPEHASYDAPDHSPLHASATLFGVFLDVTDQVLAAAALHEHAERERHAARRERLAIEQTNADLERAARHLARAKDDAERANQAKSRFLAGMSHELRTPLNGILGYAQLLELEGGLNPAQAERVRAMLQAGQHLQAMINQVLNLAEVETGKAELRLLEINLPEIARICLDLVHPTAAAKNLTLDCHFDDDVPQTLTTDPTRLRQILLNLLGNAVKFTMHGSVRLHVACTTDGNLRLQVTDTGPGIAPDKRRRLFQDFDRLETDGTVEGAGLGLALSSRLAQMLGGQIGFDDNPQGGSVFWLAIPMAQSQTAQGPNARAYALAQTDSGVPLSEPSPAVLQILVVDDVAMNRDIAASILRTGNHRVICASSGEEAVQFARSTAFDVILMDVRMPGMDGLEATRRIRASNGLSSDAPVIALTAQAFAEQVADCRAAGMDDHLAKPFTADDLLSIVQRAAATDWPRNTASATQHCPVQPDDALPVIDMAVLDQLAAFLPGGAIQPFMRSLGTQCEILTKSLATPPPTPAAIDELATMAHTLAGSAGLLGFRRVSTLARDLEHTLQQAPNTAGPVTASLAEALEATLRILPGLAEQTAQAPELVA